MSRTLRELFPPMAVEQSKNSSSRILRPDVLFSQVLVPEAARILIKDDLGVSDDEAYEVLRKSRDFGMAVHRELDADE